MGVARSGISFMAAVAMSYGQVREEPPPATVPLPAEEVRLDAATFRAALKQLGLTDVLRLHLSDFPPTDAVARLSMARDMRLADYADTSRTIHDRLAALADANSILQQMIDENPQHPQRFQWQFTHARSILYEQAESMILPLLESERALVDRDALRRLTDRAVLLVRALAADLSLESDRLDNLPAAEFERLASSGYVEQLDNLDPQVDYLLLWALYYGSFFREPQDGIRLERLHQIVDWLRSHPRFLKTDHRKSRIQIQSLLLAGMSYRLLRNDHHARSLLEAARRAADELDDPAERARVEWATTLAWIESARNHRDAGRYDEALATMQQFRRRAEVQEPGKFRLRLAAALLERDILLAAAGAAAKAGDTTEEHAYRLASWKGVVRLLRDEPEHKVDAYTVAAGLIPPDANAASLDPFDKCAVIADLLSTPPGASPAATTRDYEAAVRMGDLFLERHSKDASFLVPEVVFNVAVAEFRLGNKLQAVRRFLEVADRYPGFEQAEQAARFAVQLGFERYDAGEPTAGTSPAGIYGDALRLMVERYGETESGRYWRFFYAQWLDDQGHYADAARVYATVDEHHPQYLESLFLRARSIALDLRERAGMRTADPSDLRIRAGHVESACGTFRTHAQRFIESGPPAARMATIRQLLEQSRLIQAESFVLPGTGRAAEALALLEDAESEWADGDAGLVGRMWRVRLAAFDQLGRLDEASAAIPAFLATDPQGAAATLQSLYDSIVADTERLGAVGDGSSAGRRAETALILARQLVRSAEARGAPAEDQRSLRIQFADANRRAGRLEAARDLYATVQPPADRAHTLAGPGDVNAVFGLAETLYRLGDFADALESFNRLAVQLAVSRDLRWRSLLRDLQCRTALQHPPGDVIKVIEQQRYLFPELGGEHLAREFDRLLQENRRRAVRDPRP